MRSIGEWTQQWDGPTVNTVAVATAVVVLRGHIPSDTGEHP